MDMKYTILALFYLMYALIIPLAIASAQTDIDESAAPVRLATVPIIVNTKTRVSEEGLRHMEYKIANAVHVPLNDTLKWVDYIPAYESNAAFKEVRQEVTGNRKKIKFKELMKPLANKLNADIVICTVIHHCKQYTIMTFSWDHNLHLVSTASVEMIIYDSRTDEIKNKKTSRFYNGDYDQRGTCEFLALECIDILIEELQPRNKLTRY